MQLQNLSIRSKLALILGMTIFALAGTRALGLYQLGGFLDRFKDYIDRIEIAQKALDGERMAQPPVAAQGVPRDFGGVAVNDAVIMEARVKAAQARVEALYVEARAARDTEVVIMNSTYVSMLILVFGAGALAYALILKMITRPLHRVVQVADTVAHGDLRSEVRAGGDDELGRVMRSLGDMNRGLIRLIGNVRGLTLTIGKGSDDIASTNADFSERMAVQSVALRQTAATMQQLSAGVGLTAKNAQQASDRVTAAGRIAAKGGEEVACVAGMMSEIDASARRITEIIGVIDGIAFQTNLLAVNAAVEAARAGDNGRGFAVVATEVRHLAKKSADAAREVRRLIEDSLTKVGQGASAVRQARETMSQIVDNAGEVTLIVSEIADLSARHASGLAQANQAVSDMDIATRQNAELVERAARAAMHMHEQAKVLGDAVAVFQLPGNASLGHSPEQRGGSPLSANRRYT